MKRFVSAVFAAVIALSVSVPGSAEEKMPEVSAKACVLIEEKTGQILFEKNSVPCGWSKCGERCAY